VSARGIDAIRRRSEAWLAARAKMRAKIMADGGLRYLDDEGGAASQAHRDRAALLNEIDLRDVMIADLRREIGELKAAIGGGA
jgi:hypothetical protein